MMEWMISCHVNSLEGNALRFQTVCHGIHSKLTVVVANENRKKVGCNFVDMSIFVLDQAIESFMQWLVLLRVTPNNGSKI